MIEWKSADYTLYNGTIAPAGVSIRLGDINQGSADAQHVGDKVWLSSQTFAWEIGQADPNQSVNMLLLRIPGLAAGATPPLLSDIYSNFSIERSLKTLFYDTDKFRAYKWKVKWTYTRTINRVDPTLNKIWAGRKKVSLRHSQQYISGSAIAGSPYILYVWTNTGSTTADVYLYLKSRIVYNDL